MGAASASCPAGVEYDGHFYQQWSGLPVEKGRLLGAADYPGCDDGGCTNGIDDPDQPTRVWALRGVDPRDVVVGRDRGSGRLVLFGRLQADPQDYFRLHHGQWERRTSERQHP